jgi:DNA-binding CsgD family transcriptional regulator
LAAEAIDGARRNDHGLAYAIAEWAVAVLDLSRGRFDLAAERLTALGSGRPGGRHPYYELVSAADLVEASVRSGRPEPPPAFTALERFAGAGAPFWASALVARCRALLAEGEPAASAYARALELHAAANRPFDLARTQLLYGEFLRRQRRRSDAREQLRSAVAAFELLGASAWEERARVELRATGETARKREPGTILELTPQEQQIAGLAAGGHSNKEIASQLFLSPRTVEYHLRKIFSKLGISSRAELLRLDLKSQRGREAAALA